MTNAEQEIMKGSDLRIIADILKELKKRWPGGLSEANLPNVHSFLTFRLKQRVPDFDQCRFLARIQAKLANVESGPRF